MTEEPQGKGFAYWLLLAYFFFEYARPQELLPFLAPLRIPGILELLMPVVWLVAGKKSVLRERPIQYSLIFLCVIAVTVTFAVNTFWVFQRSKQMFIVLFAGMLPAASFLGDARRMRDFLKFWIVTQFAVALACLKNGGVGTGSFLLDENDLALALCMAIPYPFFLRKAPGTSRARGWFYLAAMATMILGVAATTIPLPAVARRTITIALRTRFFDHHHIAPKTA
ncbi:MAG: hypothetical protein AAFX94_17800, partial [Myxococcota bacterium]